jgi:hypothetical protein
MASCECDPVGWRLAVDEVERRTGGNENANRDFQRSTNAPIGLRSVSAVSRIKWRCDA